MGPGVITAFYKIIGIFWKKKEENIGVLLQKQRKMKEYRTKKLIDITFLRGYGYGYRCNSAYLI